MYIPGAIVAMFISLTLFNLKELDLKGKVLHLETELQKQRERCLTLIEEKEDEVASLKSSVSLALEAALAASVQPTTSKSPTR